jgi:hypothetical protein
MKNYEFYNGAEREKEHKETLDFLKTIINRAVDNPKVIFINDYKKTKEGLNDATD